VDYTFAESFIAETMSVLREIDADQIEAVARGLAAARNQRGRLFILGVGGSASYTVHAVNDFRRVCKFEAYTPTGGPNEPTSRLDDESWNNSFCTWLSDSHLTSRDAVLILSVGGGDSGNAISVNLIRAIDLAKQIGASVLGIVGRDGGYTAQSADACVVIPPVFSNRVSPHTQRLCAVVWHLLVNHPVMQPSPVVR
jgi:D-sedoheptulose 7-phosphate isomerase